MLVTDTFEVLVDYQTIGKLLVVRVPLGEIHLLHSYLFRDGLFVLLNVERGDGRKAFVSDWFFLLCRDLLIVLAS
jgi:hypothetical protein